ncbi:MULTISPECIES: SUKH-3 domain-containing protein [unclassified Actinoplanes]|uniref:SUKH-3 domain-containing protein n=1 Tax=unclassified Actinoplanes TaxID=2626549 RepID=UPI0012F727D9|nr:MULTISPECIES: SUKH-3 domain-containing protein [unclassified Actinoplanes]
MIKFDRFDSELLSVLEVSGWSTERDVDIAHWVEQLKLDGFDAHGLALEVLRSFGGLSIAPVREDGPNFSNDDPLNFDPAAGGFGQRSLASEVESILGGNFYPIGEWLSHSSVFVESGGMVVATGMGWIWGLGDTFEDALQLAVCANRPLRCLYTSPGLEPWPKI